MKRVTKSQPKIVAAEVRRRSDLLTRRPPQPDRLLTSAATWNSRLRAEWRFKLFLIVALNLAVCVPYYILQRNHFFPATLMPPSSLDLLIPFSPGAVWLYLSLYLFMPIGPLLMVDRRQLVHYGIAMAAMAFVASVVFAFWPTICQRPPVTHANAGYRLLTGIDNPYHAFPSLHAAFAVFSALCGELVWRELRSSLLWRMAWWIWCGLILYATLATKQHVAADILAGSILSVGIYFCTLGKNTSLEKICSKP